VTGFQQSSTTSDGFEDDGQRRTDAEAALTGVVNVRYDGSAMSQP
jgi:hypothetical protein